MEKTIILEDKEIKLNNNANWFFIYRDQFGHDIIPTLMPMLATTINLAMGLIDETGKTDAVTIRDIVKIADSDAMLNALVHLSGLEFVELINIFWALAKNADESIAEPSRWVKQFDTFPVDEIAPVIFSMIISGVISSKNWERMRAIMSKIDLHPETK